jgi:hypothetical protein
MECALVSKTIFAPRKIASLAVTLSSCRWLARRVLSMVGALPHQPKPGHYFTSDIDAYLHYKEPRRARVRARVMGYYSVGICASKGPLRERPRSSNRRSVIRQEGRALDHRLHHGREYGQTQPRRKIAFR